MNTFTLTVTKFNSIVRDIFNSEELLHNVKIVGEVFGISSSKNSVYFSIKDEESSLPCVCFNDAAANVHEGDQVVVTGSPNFYVKGGRFSFIVSKVEQYGQGLLFQKFLELKSKLEKEGLFDTIHKQKIPTSVKRIGVVTSKDGAVIQDIKNVTWRRNPTVDIVLYDTKVQGRDAEKEIAAGINFFSQYENVDVVIVARGGGSLEDLAAYNTELVARAAYDCQKPLVSAVGHETDFTIIDFVSDLRAPTPSAAAEILTKDTKNLFEIFKKDLIRISRRLSNFVADQNLWLKDAKIKMVANMENLLKERTQKLHRQALLLSSKAEKMAVEREYGLKLKLASLSKLNPLDILALGYAKIEQQGKVVAKLCELNKNSAFEINFVDGTVSARTEKD